MRLLDSRRQGDGELSDSDDEGEGGRRNHAEHRDRDSVSASRSSGNESITNGRKFGMGVGIMSSGQTATTHGAGPSGHTTVPPVIATVGSRDSSAMEIDDASGPAIPSPKEKTPEGVVTEMTVDPPAEATGTDI